MFHFSANHERMNLINNNNYFITLRSHECGINKEYTDIYVNT